MPGKSPTTSCIPVSMSNKVWPISGWIIKNKEITDIKIVDIRYLNKIFDRDKMYRSLSLALRKRDIETEKIEKIVNAIVRKLENSGEGEINTGLIGQYIMEALSSLDQVAYVRFASVYKNFREVKDFEDFLGNLEDK